jgi:hypothetical protein
MSTDTAVRAGRGTGFQIGGFLAVVLLTAASWWGLLGWDTEKTLVPGSTTSYEGPYETWQVVVFVLLLLGILIGAILLGVRPVPAATALTLSVTLNFLFTALMTPDGDGLFVIGAGLILVGSALGSALVATVTHQLAKRRRG